MGSQNESNERKGELKQIKPTFILNNIKSNYILKYIFDFMKKNKFLEFIKHNKIIQKKLNITIKDYKEYFESIEIEIIPSENKIGKFINFNDKKEHYQIFFDNRNEEIKRNNLTEEDKVSKIIITISSEVKSFKNLFSRCECVKSISFKRFNRNDITNMSHLFYECTSLVELDLTKFDTSNVEDMDYMFCACSSLKKINISNFNTNNVFNMMHMFGGCSSLEELDLSNFNIRNVEDMSYMFYECSSLKRLDISSFRINNKNTYWMFEDCSSLEELHIDNSINDFEDVEDMIRSLLYDCSDELKNRIREKYKKIDKDNLLNIK